MNVQNTLLKDLVNYRFLMLKLWHGSFFFAFHHAIVVGLSLDLVQWKSCILSLFVGFWHCGTVLFVGGRLFPGKTCRDCRCFLPRPQPPAGFLTLQPGWDWGELGKCLGWGNWNSPPLEVQKKNHTQILHVCGRQLSAPNGPVCFWVVKELKFQTLGGCRYAWLVKIHLSDLFDWAHPSSSPPVLLTKNGPT